MLDQIYFTLRPGIVTDQDSCTVKNKTVLNSTKKTTTVCARKNMLMQKNSTIFLKGCVYIVTAFPQSALGLFNTISVTQYSLSKRNWWKLIGYWIFPLKQIDHAISI